MTNIKFSLIVPIYNVEKYLAQCLDSILSQNFSNYELICINDASTDSSYQILLSYKSQYENIVVINNQVNRGLSYSRNVGLEVARGEYVWFIDSDDFIKEGVLSILNDYLKKEKVDVINFNYDVWEEGEKSKEKHWNIEKKYYDDFEIKDGKKWLVDCFSNKAITVMAWTRIYRRQFLLENNLRFYERLLHEDNLFFFQMVLVAESVIDLGVNLYTYRRRDGSISVSLNTKRLDSYVIIANEMMAIWKTKQVDESVAEVIKFYISSCLYELQKLMTYFPEHKRLEIGKEEDQFFFELLQTSNRSKRNYVQLDEGMIKKILSYDKRVIFGAGNVACELIEQLDTLQIKFEGIVVSNKELNPSQISGHEVSSIHEWIKEREEILVIVAIVSKNQNSIVEMLKEMQFKNTLCLTTTM